MQRGIQQEQRTVVAATTNATVATDSTKCRTTLTQRLQSWPWWHWLLGINAFLLVWTVAMPHLSGAPEQVRRSLGLAVEMNVGAWWSTVLLLTSALFAYELFSMSVNRLRTAWCALALVMAGLSLDELGSFHERIIKIGGGTNWSNYIPFAVVSVALLGYILTNLVRENDTRRTAIMIAIGFVLLSTVVLAEYLEHHVKWPSWVLGIRSATEEGLELAGMSVIMWALIRQRTAAQLSMANRIAVPNPLRMKAIVALILAGLLAHGVLTLITVPLGDLAKRGYPAAWYPVAVYVVLACATVWTSREDAVEDRRPRLLLAAYFVLCSLATVLYMRGLAPEAQYLDEPIIRLFLVCQPGLLVVLSRSADMRVSTRTVIILAMLMLLLGTGMLAGWFAVQLLLVGVAASAVAVMFFPVLYRSVHAMESR